MSKFCPNCGKEQPDDAVFCNGCGINMGGVSSNPVNVVRQNYGQGGYSQPNYGQGGNAMPGNYQQNNYGQPGVPPVYGQGGYGGNYGQPGPGKNNILFIVIAAVAALIFIGVIFIAVKSFSDKDKTETAFEEFEETAQESEKESKETSRKEKDVKNVEFLEEEEDEEGIEENLKGEESEEIETTTFESDILEEDELPSLALEDFDWVEEDTPTNIANIAEFDEILGNWKGYIYYYQDEGEKELVYAEIKGTADNAEMVVDPYLMFYNGEAPVDETNISEFSFSGDFDSGWLYLTTGPGIIDCSVIYSYQGKQYMVGQLIFQDGSRAIVGFMRP